MGARHNSKAGYTKTLSKLNQSRFVLAKLTSFALWHENVKDQNTSVTIRCTQCNSVFKLTLRSLNKHKQPFDRPCRCKNKTQSWEYYQRFLAIQNTSKYKATGIKSFEDWKTVVAQSGVFTHLDVVCQDCGFRGRPSLSTFITTGKSGCWCTGSVQTSSPEYFAYIKNMLKTTRFVLETTFDEWSTNVTNAHSRVCIRCKFCNATCTPVVNMIQCGRVGCGCSNVSERRVATFLAELLQDDFVIRRQGVLNDVRGPGKRLLNFDFLLLDGHDRPFMAIEIDGGHHFDPDFRYGYEDGTTRSTIKNDLIKELACMSTKIPMLRIESDVISKNAMAWNAWLQGVVTARINGELRLGIYRLARCQSYQSGMYHEVRKPYPKLETKHGIVVPASPIPFPPMLS